MSVRAATLKFNFNVRTVEEYIQRASGSGRPVGRPPVLTDEQKNYMIQWADENANSVVLGDMLDALIEKLCYLQITKSGFYKFVRQKYEASFHINLERNFSWPKEGSRAVVKVPRTRAKTTTILGVISPFGVENIGVRCFRAFVSLKKRKATGGTKAKESNNSGTVTGHYFNFISSVLDVMNRHEQFRGHCLVMDNAPIHKHEDIQNHIESRGYECMYQPPYSPEPNLIEQFWSVCKSKIKREQLLDEETPTTRIANACNRVLYTYCSAE
ncbi:hypothetical protein G6F57_007946 [Rhizopus arrhizus]|uniref:Tc1-like transposase DDE domain-containing protein n=1 Tax=Rhizopus oryzae TaxID=64495 RepID=A0A9P6X6F7_RHIOR|nr:hypothetical protein G6F23_002979 [Rhizopus arrhizus]KAG1415088.1 hypothetical protein G6F58_006647 [Rhizopus delemar]KAG0761204.1 hypothetical protein G6F24_007740 [Rhizopus arrhizus]KAG0792692.1 hypothetical protein G6F21_004167 [Rhizopus arrhizus]KAG0819622.1 hypothetical protein G6F20_000597 [Rhizopus arrhizus]